jgi:hypothetical protein
MSDYSEEIKDLAAKIQSGEVSRSAGQKMATDKKALHFCLTGRSFAEYLHSVSPETIAAAKAAEAAAEKAHMQEMLVKHEAMMADIATYGDRRQDAEFQTEIRDAAVAQVEAMLEAAGNQIVKSYGYATESRYIQFRDAEGDQFVVRVADHAAPVNGGFSIEKGEQHGPADFDLRINPFSGALSGLTEFESQVQ